MTDSAPMVARQCNNDFVKFLVKASELHMVGKLRLDDDYKPIPHPPMWLTDRHLAPNYVLQRVILVSDLIQDMAQEGNREMIRFLSENDVFPGAKDLPSPKIRPDNNIWGPMTFMFIYEDQIARTCQAFASAMYVMPNQQQYEPAFRLLRHEPRPVFLNQAELKLYPDHKHPYDFNFSEEASKKVHPSVISKLRGLRDQHNCLATFNFLPPCPESDSIVIEAVAYNPQGWSFPATISPIRLGSFERQFPLDTPNRWWSTYAPSVGFNSGQVKPYVTKQTKTVWIPPRKGTRHQYEPTASEFLQRAWCRAVETETTFLVISSGTKERIGIRHRETGTLFLSPLIEPYEMHYMRIHMFLYTSVLKEAMERAIPHSLSDESQATRKRKQQSDVSQRRISKRLRGELPSQYDVDNFDLYKEISRRRILLVSFNFDVYHSLSPSSFLRVSPSCHPDFVNTLVQPPKSNKRYLLRECMNFVATEKIASGSAAAVFRGVVQIQTEGGGKMIEERVVLKIPLGTQPPSKIYDEYKTYVNFSAAGIMEGILPVYGVFEDVETGSLAMMIRDGGIDLWQREREREGRGLRSDWMPGQISLSEEEFDVLHQVIKCINMLGILHFDIKPNNILCDESGKVYIIDFDSAWPQMWKLGDPESADLLTLHDLFARKFVKDKHYPR
ncbi:hypothetical protein BJ165DRAFT_1485833 [Panaeolus papilionaceus]|nr:hypothetical protein BJ165DRAFT_1485833 [Panaeolus papilionaceus]